MFGKVKKFIEDFNNFKTGIITLGQLANNGTTTATGLALDARYGKTLADQINTLNNSLNTIKSTKGLFGNYGDLVITSSTSDANSIEGSQIDLYGMGGNKGDFIMLDGYNNGFRIFGKLGGTSTTVWEFKYDGIFANGVKKVSV
jgi:hypothetical protein